MTHALATSPAVDVTNLDIVCRAGRETLVASRNISFEVSCGEVFGLIGETGSGKSTILRSIIGLLHRNAQIEAGTIRVGGHLITGASNAELVALRRQQIAMVFQDPLRALNPVMKIEAQLAEAARSAGVYERDAVWALMVETLERVGIADPLIRLRAYPHELSGGLRQRMVIAAAIIRSPTLILADEPTTALDVTIQDQILTLLRQLCCEMGTSIILVTHDMGVVAQACDRVGVLYAGRLVETGEVSTVLTTPAHPYTAALIAAIPRIGERRARLQVIPGRPADLSLAIDGCPFAPRCSYAVPDCTRIKPDLRIHGGTQATACWRHAELQPILAAGVA